MATKEKIKEISQRTDSIFDRVPPQAIDAERGVLGSIMLDNDCIGRVLEILEPDYFYKNAHTLIMSAALTLYEKNDPVDLITMSEALKRRKVLDDIGGVYYLTEITESVPSSANVEHHARIVLEKYLLRKLIEESAGIARDSYEAVEDVFELIDKAEHRIFALSDKRLRQGFQHISPIMHSAMETVDLFHQKKGAVTGVSTGFTKMDELTSGMHNGELLIVAGRPSMGKTAFAMNVARNAAVEHKVPVGIFSLEMSMEQLAIRLLCAEARVDAHGLRTGRLPDSELQKLSLEVGHLAEAPIYIDDSPGATVLELRTKARRLKKEKDLGLVVVDYLQLMQGPKGMESRQQEISTISRSLKALAKELNLPVLALSQLSRAVEQRGGDKRPMLSDLRESGAIEQDADVVMFVYRPEFYLRKEDPQFAEIEGRAEIIIGKQRNGPVGTVNLTFIKKYARFENPAFEEAPIGFGD